MQTKCTEIRGSPALPSGASNFLCKVVLDLRAVQLPEAGQTFFGQETPGSWGTAFDIKVSLNQMLSCLC